jgi:hypothetical protein
VLKNRKRVVIPEPAWVWIVIGIVVAPSHLMPDAEPRIEIGKVIVESHVCNPYAHIWIAIGSLPRCRHADSA